MAKTAWKSTFSNVFAQQHAAALSAGVPAAIASGVPAAASAAARTDLGYASFLSPRIDRISGAYGARVFPFNALPTAFASTKDGFFNAGQTLRTRFATYEGRLGHAPGFGWGRNVGFAATQPSWGWLERLGLRLDCNRQSQRGMALFATSGDAWKRTGGMQKVAGTLFNWNLSLQLFRLTLPFDYSTEHKATLNRRGVVSAVPFAWRHNLYAPAASPSFSSRLQLHSTHAPSGERPKNLLRRAWQAFHYGAASQQEFTLQGQLDPHTTRNVRMGKAYNFGLNFDKFWPLCPVRLRWIHRHVDNIEMSRRTSNLTAVQFDRSISEERRIALAVPITQNLNYLPSAIRMAMPQAWLSTRKERKLTSQFIFSGHMQSNAAWCRLARDWKVSNGGVQQSLPKNVPVDDALAQEFARLRGLPGTGHLATVEGVVAEERHEKRGRIGCMLGFLPFRSSHISPFDEKIYTQGSRTSLRDPNARTHLVAGDQAALQRSHETFQEVSYEENRAIRLHARTEVKAHWLSTHEHALKNITMRTVWTFNPKNEALREVNPGEIGAVVDQINRVFDTDLHKPQPQKARQARGERRISATFQLAPEDLDYLQQVWAQTPLAASDFADHNLDPAALQELHAQLRQATTGKQRAACIAAFVTGASYVVPAGASSAQKHALHLAPASAQAAAWLRSLLPNKPEMKMDVASNQHGLEMERVKAIILRYSQQDIGHHTSPHELRDRVARVLRGRTILDELHAAYVGDQFYAEHIRNEVAQGIALMREGLANLLSTHLVQDAPSNFAHKLNHCGLSVEQRDKAMKLMLRGNHDTQPMLNALQKQTQAPFLFQAFSKDDV